MCVSDRTDRQDRETRCVLYSSRTLPAGSFPLRRLGPEHTHTHTARETGTQDTQRQTQSKQRRHAGSIILPSLRVPTCVNSQKFFWSSSGSAFTAASTSLYPLPCTRCMCVCVCVCVCVRARMLRVQISGTHAARTDTHMHLRHSSTRTGRRAGRRQVHLWSKAAFGVTPVPVNAVEYGEKRFLFKERCGLDAGVRGGMHARHAPLSPGLAPLAPNPALSPLPSLSSPSPCAKSRSANNPLPPIGDGCTATASCSGYCGTGYSSSSSSSSSPSTSAMASKKRGRCVRARSWHGEHREDAAAPDGIHELQRLVLDRSFSVPASSPPLPRVVLHTRSLSHDPVASPQFRSRNTLRARQTARIRKS